MNIFGIKIFHAYTYLPQDIDLNILKLCQFVQTFFGYFKIKSHFSHFNLPIWEL